MMVLSIYKQPGYTPGFKAKPNPYVKEKIFPSLLNATIRLEYWSNKCRYEQQGEKISQEMFETYLNQVKDMNNEQFIKIRWAAFDIKTVTDTGTWEENFPEVLYMYLSKYHSDMRW